MQFSRRQFFHLLAAAPLTAAVKRNMIVLSKRPEDLEMPLDGFSTWITPVDRFFVRSHHYVPKVDLATWRLTVDGESLKPLTLTFADLQKLPAIDTVSV
ncbi:MAG: molybdopterin-dependent oxidoreductase, partial [Bryobacteraceae bacterium]